MSSDSILDRIESEAKKALLQNAFFRLESAVVIGGAILLTAFQFQPFPGWPWWAWPAIGLIGEVAVVVSSLTDKAELQKVMESLFREKYSTSGIRDRGLRDKLNEAEQYRQRIQQMVNQQKSGVLRDRLVSTTAEVYDWIANMVTLARRVDSYRSDDIIKRDTAGIAQDIKTLQARMTLERDGRVKEQMATTLESKRQFAENLAELTNRMQRADLQLDHSLASLGTVYSQLLLIGSKEVDSDRADRLRSDIRDEVSALQDLVESLNEVYSYSPEKAAEPIAAQVRRQVGRASG
jgi:hypothetical protein